MSHEPLALCRLEQGGGPVQLEDLLLLPIDGLLQVEERVLGEDAGPDVEGQGERLFEQLDGDVLLVQREEGELEILVHGEEVEHPAQSLGLLLGQQQVQHRNQKL